MRNSMTQLKIYFSLALLVIQAIGLIRTLRKEKKKQLL